MSELVPVVSCEAGFLERLEDAAAVSKVRAAGKTFASDPTGKEESRKSIFGHAGDVAEPLEVPSNDVCVDVVQAEALVDISRGDVMEPGAAIRDSTHTASAVIVEPSKFGEHAFGEAPGFCSVEEDREDGADVGRSFGVWLNAR